VNVKSIGVALAAATPSNADPTKQSFFMPSPIIVMLLNENAS
jgi:hypothetical protein